MLDWLKDTVGDLFSGSNLSSLITAGLTTAGNLYKPEDPQAFGNTQAGFEATQALEREKMAQAMQIAQMNAASAGAGSGAALEAARLGARVNLAALREKAAADSIAAALQSFAQNQNTLTAANQQRIGAAQGLGSAGLQGFGAMANLLSNYRR